jgi:hypothetical protein
VNRAFLIIAIPAFLVSFTWMTFGWGWKISVPVTILELAAAIGGVVYLRKREARATEK